MMPNNIQDRLVAFVWTFLCVLTATAMCIFFRANLKCCCFDTRWIQKMPPWLMRTVRRTAWTHWACLMQCPSFLRTSDGGGRPAPRDSSLSYRRKNELRKVKCFGQTRTADWGSKADHLTVCQVPSSTASASLPRTAMYNRAFCSDENVL